MTKQLSLKQRILAERLLFSASNWPHRISKLLAVASPLATIIFLMLCYGKGHFASGGFLGLLLECWDSLTGALIWIASWSVEFAIKPRILNDYRKEDFYKQKRGQEILRDIRNTSDPNFSIEFCENGAALTSDILNRLLITKPYVPFRIEATSWVAYTDQNETLRQFVILDAAWQGSAIFNSEKIRLLTDLSVDPQTGKLKDVPIVIQKTDYVSSLMTDAVAFQSIHASGHRDLEELSDGIRTFAIYNRVGKATLRPMSSNELSNQVGVSTLAFSRDGHLAIAVQTGRNMHSQGKHCPTGSGSLDWADLRAQKSGEFLTHVYDGAKRELREEAGLQCGKWPRQEEVASDLLMFAFARLLHRGGKPEFFFVARVDADMRELERRRRTWREKVYTELVYGYAGRRLDFHSGIAPHRQLFEICDDYIGKREKNIPSYKRLDFSYQLEHALKLLQKACLNEVSAEKLDEFFLREGVFNEASQ